MKKAIHLLFIFLLGFTVFFTTGCEEELNNKPCVVILGDSIFAASDEEQAFLEDLSGDIYRAYCVSGAQMVGGVIPTIPEQYARAQRRGDVRTIILDGGGNDILIGAREACTAEYGEELSRECYDVMDNVLAETNDLFEEAVEDGVENIVFQAYYYVTDETLWQVTDVFMAMAAEFSIEIAARYPQTKFVYIDPREAFLNHPEYIKSDGIHPTTAGSEVLANLVWDAMVENNVEQNDTCD